MQIILGFQKVFAILLTDECCIRTHGQWTWVWLQSRSLVAKKYLGWAKKKRFCRLTTNFAVLTSVGVRRKLRSFDCRWRAGVKVYVIIESKINFDNRETSGFRPGFNYIVNISLPFIRMSHAARLPFVLHGSDMQWGREHRLFWNAIGVGLSGVYQTTFCGTVRKISPLIE